MKDKEMVLETARYLGVDEITVFKNAYIDNFFDLVEDEVYEQFTLYLQGRGVPDWVKIYCDKRRW